MTQVAANRCEESEAEAPDVMVAAAHRNLAKAEGEAPWLRSIAAQAAVIGSSPGPTRSKYRRFVLLAERVSKAVKPNSACSKGCSHCCNIAVAISEFEATQIGSAIGRKVLALTGESEAADAVDKYRGVPCTFLKDGRCSIYEHRPVACRVHFNLADDESMCRLEVPSEQSTVQFLNLSAFWFGNALAFGVHPQGDIREFFGLGQ